MQLIHDDEPLRFAARVVTVVRDDVRVAGTPGVVVTIDPPLDAPDIVGGELAKAILVRRHRDVKFEELRRGSMEKPGSVYVLRFSPSIADLPSELTVDDVVIVFWGLVSSSAEG
jgi:hypothetical protein